MKKIFFYLVLLIILGFNSCITYIDRELDIKPKLVLFCYLVPQLDTTIVRLTNSASLFTSNPQRPQYITHATVEISDNNINWVPLRLETEQLYYIITQADFPIIEGKTYYIRASTMDYETVYASCTVPVLRETNTNVVLRDTLVDTWGNRYMPGDISWTDYPNENNYYIFCDKSFYEWYEGEFIWNEEGLGGEWIITDTSYGYSWRPLSEPNYRRSCIYSDNGMNGKKMSIPIEVHLGTLGYSEYIWFEITQLQTDINCYLFETSMMDYNSDLQFFMLEPQQLYSNIKNGYGLFGAFVMKGCNVEN